jgi:PII-like signaling protein
MLKQLLEISSDLPIIIEIIEPKKKLESSHVLLKNCFQNPFIMFYIAKINLPFLKFNIT